MSKRANDDNIHAVENAWHIHDAQADWTGKVDAKASFSFAIQSALLAAVVALVAGDKLFTGFRGWWVGLFIVGVLSLGAGAVTAAWVVAPLLRSKDLKRESEEDHIYFGHLRHVGASELEERLRDRDLLPVLARQLVRMSAIAWKKHVLVRWSIWLGVAGGTSLTICGLLLKLGLGG